MTGKPKAPRLWQEITLTLVLKVAALFIIWFVWFSATADHPIDAEQVASHLFPQQPPQEQNHDPVPRTR